MSRAQLIWPGVPLALVSAALFGASTPLAKLLLGAGTDPWLLAGLLYLGSGIGLAIAKTVAESHGGVIQVRNCEDSGCEFTVTLPLSAPSGVEA